MILKVSFFVCRRVSKQRRGADRRRRLLDGEGEGLLRGPGKEDKRHGDGWAAHMDELHEEDAAGNLEKNKIFSKVDLM